MSTKFSPGPWTFSPDDEYCAYNIYGPVTGSHGTTYQETIAGVQQPYDSDQSRAEALANARLIAAAPEMYELLRRLAFGAWASASTEAGKEARALLARIDEEKDPDAPG